VRPNGPIPLRPPPGVIHGPTLTVIVVRSVGPVPPDGRTERTTIYLERMTTRPTERWHHLTTTQQAALAAGTISADGAWAPHLWPLEFIAAVDPVLIAYEREIADLPDPSDDAAIWAAVERVVLALNAADDNNHIETGEREALCDYLDGVLTAAGVDVEGLTARRGLGRHELTDTWRDW